MLDWLIHDIAWNMAKIMMIVLPLMGAVAYLTLAERKVIGYIQMRIGPNRVTSRAPWGTWVALGVSRRIASS
mgnify:CR=1 FL=1